MRGERFYDTNILIYAFAAGDRRSARAEALLSRAAVYVLEALDTDAMVRLFERAHALACPQLGFDEDARERVVGFADGDARRLMNLIEQMLVAAETAQVNPVTAAFVDQALSRKLRRFDKGGEAFYDQISALHKSVRGSDPDASLYWLCRMLDGGADPLYLGRRLIRMAVEDIGLADPRALEITLNACHTYERLGSPEGELALAQATIFLACAAKSNAAYKAYNAARAFVARDGSRPVPLHLRNAPTKLMKALDYGKAYRYAHDEPDGYAAGENYLPEGMPPPLEPTRPMAYLTLGFFRTTCSIPATAFSVSCRLVPAGSSRTALILPWSVLGANSNLKIAPFL